MRSINNILVALVLLGSCGCQGRPGSEGPPPPPPVPAEPHRIVAFRLGGESEIDEVAVVDMKEGLKLFQYLEGEYYTLEEIDLGGDAGSAPAQVDRAIEQGADLIALTHPALVRALASREVAKPVVFGILGDPRALGAGESDDRHRAGLTGAYHALPAHSILALAKYYLPEAKRVGVVFRGGDPLSAAHKEALVRDSARVQMEVVAADAGETDGAPAAIEGLLGQELDAICLVAGLGDATAAILDRAGRAKVPVFGFREEQVRAGALAATTPVVGRVGVEAGRLIFHVLSGEAPATLPFRPSIDTATVVNTGVAEALAITLPPGALRDVQVVGKSEAEDGD